LDSIIIFLQIVFINVLLSGDNAVVIAMASQHLPPESRRKAIWWGAAAAVGLRCILTLVAITLLQVPYLQVAGALLLFIIAVKLVTDAAGGEPVGQQLVKSQSLGVAIRTIIAADFIMSLDNVLAIAAVAKGEPILMILGITLSIPMIIWGSHLLSSLLQKFPPLVYLGGGLLGYAAGGMFVNDPGIVRLISEQFAVYKEAIPILCVPFVIVVALLRLRR